MSASAAEHRAETERTIEFFGAAGIAVFAQRLGAKGTWVTGWPAMPVAEAIALTRREARRRAINLAGRTGDGTALIDLDAKNGCDPDVVLPLLLPRLGGAVIAVVKTARGYHIWVAVSRSVGNGYCSAIGGEVFSAPHLAMLPPSVHPDGCVYSWVIEPRKPRSRVDLAALGLVPDQPSFEAGKSLKLTPAPAVVQDEFTVLMAETGIARRRRNQELFICPWHDDRHPSLSVNWETALFHCFGASCGVGGGVRKLRDLLGHTPTYRQGANPLVGKSGCADEDVEQLAQGLESLGLADKARAVRDCKKVYAVGRCTGCEASPVYPLSCGTGLCPRCMTGRLAADWRDHGASIPEGLTLLRLTPRVFWGLQRNVVRRTRSRFNEWRKRAGLACGLYGVRFVRGAGGVVLLAIPTGDAVPASSRAFDVDLVATDQTPEDCLRWLQAEYLDEATDWETDEDLALLLEETRRRRRFQGFGSAYGGGEDTPNEDKPAGEVDSESAPPPLSKVSGGSHSSPKRDVRLCPACGARVEMFDFTVRHEEVSLKEGVWQWQRPPGSQSRAA